MLDSVYVYTVILCVWHGLRRVWFLGTGLDSARGQEDWGCKEEA